MLHRALLIALLGLGVAAACPPPPEQVQLPNATASGYLSIDDKGSRLFFLFYEAQSIEESGDGEDGLARQHSRAPITLWLQGGPGCASLFGAFYELGPELVDGDLNLQPNPGAWNRLSALLFIDQPVGAGFSVPGEGRTLAKDEMTLAADMYAGLQAFFLRYPRLQARPLVVAGESYAGKYVPSIGHFILEQAAHHNSSRSRGRQALSHLRNSRPISGTLLASRPLLTQAPLFDLQALAIGNGLTDPAAQVMAHADTAYFMGYVDLCQRLRAMAMQLETVQLISAGLWEEAHALRSGLLEHIRSSAGAATLLDMRRYQDYDANKLVDCYLNLPEVKEALGAAPGVRFESCSGEVGQALGPDVMKSVKHLVPDLLTAYPLLLYQGMWDAQDGAASSEAWIYSLEWEGQVAFREANRRILRAKDLEEDGEQPGSGDSRQVEAAGSGASADVGRSGTGGEAALLLGGKATDAGVRPQRQLLQPQPAQAGEQQLKQRQQQQAGERQPGRHDAAGERVVAYWKQGGSLTHVVLAGAGHMVPRDAPLAAQYMLEQWLATALQL